MLAITFIQPAPLPFDNCYFPFSNPQIIFWLNREQNGWARILIDQIKILPRNDIQSNHITVARFAGNDLWSKTILLRSKQIKLVTLYISFLSVSMRDKKDILSTYIAG